MAIFTMVASTTGRKVRLARSIGERPAAPLTTIMTAEIGERERANLHGIGIICQQS